MNRHCKEALLPNGVMSLVKAFLIAIMKIHVKIINDVFLQLKKGSEEVLFTDNEKHRVYMRSVRDEEGNLLGYYERYEPPLVK